MVYIKKIIAFCFIFIALFTNYCSAAPFVSEWEPLTKNNKNFFYNKERIFHPDRNTVRIWTWEQGTMKLYAMRCPTKQYRIFHIIQYDSKGNVSQSLPVITKTWDFIPIGSITEKVYKIVCFKEKSE
jgi:hypothetical protein